MITVKNQITIPQRAMEDAGLVHGEVLVVRASGPGRLVLERERDVVADAAGSLTGVYQPGELDRLRDEWD